VSLAALQEAFLLLYCSADAIGGRHAAWPVTQDVELMGGREVDQDVARTIETLRRRT
jgi:hypothetical protein